METLATFSRETLKSDPFAKAVSVQGTRASVNMDIDSYPYPHPYTCTHAQTSTVAYMQSQQFHGSMANVMQRNHLSDMTKPMPIRKISASLQQGELDYPSVYENLPPYPYHEREIAEYTVGRLLLFENDFKDQLPRNKELARSMFTHKLVVIDKFNVDPTPTPPSDQSWTTYRPIASSVPPQVPSHPDVRRSRRKPVVHRAVIYNQ